MLKIQASKVLDKKWQSNSNEVIQVRTIPRVNTPCVPKSGHGKEFLVDVSFFQSIDGPICCTLRCGCIQQGGAHQAKRDPPLYDAIKKMLSRPSLGQTAFWIEPSRKCASLQGQMKPRLSHLLNGAWVPLKISKFFCRIVDAKVLSCLWQGSLPQAHMRT